MQMQEVKKYVKYDVVNKKIQPLGYQLKEELGCGTYGVVHKVEDINNKQIFAMKIIPKQCLYDRLLELQKREIFLLNYMKNQVNFAHIVKFIASMEDELYYYIIMEYCPQNLRQYLFKLNQQTLSESQVLVYFFQILLGMVELHKLEILHRDLKPENILLANGNLKLADFGFSKQVKDWQVTQTILGTALYAAPEIITGQPYNYKCDIWSLGIILFELAFKTFPFDSKTQGQILQLIKEACLNKKFSVKDRIPKSKENIYSSYSQNFISLLEQMIVYNPTERIDFSQILIHPVFKQLAESQNDSLIQGQFENNYKEIQKFYENYTNNLINSNIAKVEGCEINSQNVVTIRDIMEVCAQYDYELNKCEFIKYTMEQVINCECMKKNFELPCYFLSKTCDFYLNQLQTGMNKKENIFSVDLRALSKFIEHDYYQKILQQISILKKEQEINLLKYYDKAYQSVQQLEQREPKLKEQKTINQVTQQLVELKFDDFKVGLRSSMIVCGKLLQNQIDKFLQSNIQEKTKLMLIRLLILMCHTINRVFDRQKLQQTFKIMYKSIKDYSPDKFFDSFSQWIQFASFEDFKEQVKSLDDQFFK